MNTGKLYLYLLVMAGVTYLIRMLPFTLFRRKITSRFVLSVLHYIPFAVLATMTIPAVFTSTGNPITAVAGLLIALVLSLFKRSLTEVALAAAAAAYIASLVL